MNKRSNFTARIPLMLVSVAGVALLGGARGALAQCDLRAVFVAPVSNALPGGQLVTWTVRFSNAATTGSQAQCAANQIRLNRYSGGTASGSGVTVGGSGNLVNLPALSPGAQVNLSFQEAASPASGTYTYKPVYATPHNDADNFNHHPTKTVVFEEQPAVQADLLVSSAQFEGGAARVGNCNVVRIVVRNQGGLANVISQAKVIVFPSGTPFVNRDEKSVNLSSFTANSTQGKDVKGLRISTPGNWTVQIVADSGQVIAESDENNNVLTLQNQNALLPCP